MPILSYFCVVGPALMALLLIANAALPEREPLKLSTDFYGLPQRGTMQGVPMLPAREAPAPDMTSDAVKLAAAPPIAEAPATTPPQAAPVSDVAATQTAAAPGVTKRRRASRQAREARDAFAQDRGWGWHADTWQANSWQADVQRSRSRRADSWRPDGRSDSWRSDSWRSDSWRSDWRSDSRRSNSWRSDSWRSEYRRAERAPWSFGDDRRWNDR